MTIFLGTLISIGSALTIFIRSYLQVNENLTNFVTKYQLEAGQFQDTKTWVTILLLSLLVAGTLFGVFLIFIYYQKLVRLYRLQQNFINGFTHELKTPITSLRLYLDTFKKHNLEKEEQDKYLDYMIHDTERLTLNVNQILQMAKIEERGFGASLQSTNLKTYIENIFTKNIHYFEGFAVTVTNPDNLNLYYEIDLELFELIIMNITTNATTYNNSDQPKLDINFQQNSKNLIITFSDNGIGIDKSELKNVFKKMYQIGKTTKGSGLGLYLASNIVKIHKGKLTVSSPGLGHGTTFTIFLPIKKPNL